ncbi:MAG: cytochrome c [Planctomycetota bacterium]
MFRTPAVLLTLSALLLPACGGEKDNTTPNTDPAKGSATANLTLDDQATDSPAMKEAKGKFRSVCAGCHGTTGQGDGEMAKNFPVKPRSYSDQAWQASVTDAHLAKVILEGGPAVGKHVLMPASQDLADKKEVVDSLVALIRSYRK